MRYQILVLGSGKGREWDGLSRGRGERKGIFLKKRGGLRLELEGRRKRSEKKGEKGS